MSAPVRNSISSHLPLAAIAISIRPKVSPGEKAVTLHLPTRSVERSAMPVLPATTFYASPALCPTHVCGSNSPGTYHANEITLDAFGTTVPSFSKVEAVIYAKLSRLPEVICKASDRVSIHG